jgi:hypothetical protein
VCVNDFDQMDACGVLRLLEKGSLNFNLLINHLRFMIITVSVSEHLGPFSGIPVLCGIVAGTSGLQCFFLLAQFKCSPF